MDAGTGAAPQSGRLTPEWLRSQTVGADTAFATPFGERMMVYCDYTASGRCLHFVENYLVSLQRHYANTHTEDDVTGRNMTHLLRDAEQRIKRSVNAGPDGCIIATGTGATGAIDKAQQILGLACSPASRQQIDNALRGSVGADGLARYTAWQRSCGPVVFVGPYEHHSNEISWRQTSATVVEVDLATDGGIDLGHLERLLRSPEYLGRRRIGSFSAASNVTGMLSPVSDIARLLHRHDALACFDYAACAPYIDIDMNPAGDPDASIDAVFISPHKFLGGPGSSGILVFNKRIYPLGLAPTVAAGGTVDYVGPDDQDFIQDIEEREKAGTPGVMQTLKAALVFDIKDRVGTRFIAARERELLDRALARWREEPGFEILGNPDPARRIGIVSFNLRDTDGRYLHPKFLTALFNDLFGIQSRAGCSCAGPYGHRLLGIDEARSRAYRRCIGEGWGGLKPGWCRIGFHYTMDDAEADYVIEAVALVARHGRQFLKAYDFDPHSGAWQHREDTCGFEPLSIEAAVRTPGQHPTALSVDRRQRLYASYLAEAARRANELSGTAAGEEVLLEGGLAELQYFPIQRNNCG